MGAVIKVENLSKQYRLGDVGTGSLKDDFKRFRYRLMGKENPFLQVGDVNERTKKSNSDYVWALKDINFEIEQGDVVGIIGRNGAGKSTLLKILSRTTAPTTGSVKVKGRIASLLEVGTGFHGELSGRENIYLNGAIMGLRKWEIDKKMDEIIDFAGVEKYLDTPVKRYSSGMYVRLAFAVAAHLEPDILIVDEVLAVGDAEFQNKCLGKINEVSKGQGRTVIFVSHNEAAVIKLCQNGILLKNGEMVKKTVIKDILQEYKGSVVDNLIKKLNIKYSDAIIHEIKILANESDNILNITLDDKFEVGVYFTILEDYTTLAFTLGFWHKGEAVFLSLSDENISKLKPYKKGSYVKTCQIPKCFLNNIDYSISLNLYEKNFQNPNTLFNVLNLSIIEGTMTRGEYMGGYLGCIRPKLNWTLKTL